MNVFKQLYVSLYSPKDMATFRNQGIGKTILFVFLLTLISIIPSSYYFNVMIKDGIHMIQETISTEMPNFEIKNGKLTVEGGQPTIINKNGFVIFVDDSGKVNPDEVSSRFTNGIALLKSEFVIISEGNVQSSPYSFIEGTNQSISLWMDEADRLLWVFLAIMMFIFYIVAAALMFLKVTIFAVFGLIIKNALAKPLRYAELWKISAYCLTLPTIFFTIMDIFQTTVPLSMTLSWFIIFILLLLTLKEVPEE